MPDPRRHGPVLPYRLLAGVVPGPAGWLVVSAKLHGITVSPEHPRLVEKFVDVLDTKPALDVISLATAVGLPDEPVSGGRSCDREARALIGWPRCGAVISAPTRKAAAARTYAEARRSNGGRLSAVAWRRMRRVAEVDSVIAPYWQRTVFEVNPELSFWQLNNERLLTHSKHTEAGIEERIRLLSGRLAGLGELLTADLPGTTVVQRLDGGACLWTARRIAARAITRLPEHPEWDALGLRMEIVR